MITARWRVGTRFTADAQKCADEISEICEDIGSASPRDILDKARNEDTELHKCFTWDDSVAAERFRLIEAGTIVRHLIIKEEGKPSDEDGEDRPPMRVFYKTTEDEGYKPTEMVVQKKDEYQALLSRAWDELRRFKAKYQMLSELEEIFALID